MIAGGITKACSHAPE